MFGLIADVISSALTILLPVFASYKALRSSDPSHLAPWLMYWVVLSVILLAESWTAFILGWIPFYSWIRLFFFAYLVLPQTQGARSLYQDYVDPFLERHERTIEEFIGRAHERAWNLGLQYFYLAANLIREKILGRPPQRPTTPPPPVTGPATYAQGLLSRFHIPTAAPQSDIMPATSDWFSAIGSVVSSMASSGKSNEARIEELSASGHLFPREMASMSRTEKAQFISRQRDLLDVLREALTKEQTNLGEEEPEADGPVYGVPLKENCSDNSFDHIEHEDIGSSGGRRTSGWGSGWFGGASGEIRRR